MIDAAEGLSNRSGVGNHAHGALHPGKVTTGNDSGRLIVDTTECGGMEALANCDKLKHEDVPLESSIEEAARMRGVHRGSSKE